MTSVGLLMRLYLGWKRDLPEMQAGTDYLLEHLPEPGTPQATKRDTYYWYYATQVLFHMGGERWKKWNDKLRPLLLDSQILEGELTAVGILTCQFRPMGSIRWSSVCDHTQFAIVRSPLSPSAPV